jgi:hypothetical protein
MLNSLIKDVLIVVIKLRSRLRSKPMQCLRCGHCCKYYSVVIVDDPERPFNPEDPDDVEDNTTFQMGDGTPCGQEGLPEKSPEDEEEGIIPGGREDL